MNVSPTTSEPEITVFHADHGVSLETIRWAIGIIKPTAFFLCTLTLPKGHADLMNAMHGPICGDDPVPDSECVMATRGSRPNLSRLCARPMRSTNLLTVIGTAKPDGSFLVFTAYGGPAAEREPSDPSLTDGDRPVAEKFWREHALSIGTCPLPQP